jgi:hypothetical protein
MSLLTTAPTSTSYTNRPISSLIPGVRQGPKLSIRTAALLWPRPKNTRYIQISRSKLYLVLLYELPGSLATNSRLLRRLDYFTSHRELSTRILPDKAPNSGELPILSEILLC